MTIFSYAPGGYHGHIVSVEVDCRTGIPGMDIVGLPASEVREARDRARVAIRNSGFDFPTRRILVSLAPADVPKSGNGFDLAIAAAILAGSDQLHIVDDEPVMMIGELHLDGSVGPVRGVLAAVAEGMETGIRRYIVPSANAAEAAAVSTGRASGVCHLADLTLALGPSGSGRRSAAGPRDAGSTRIRVHGKAPAAGSVPGAGPVARTTALAAPEGTLTDYAQLRGVSDLKRALLIAAAGGHHLLVVGAPGAGKSAAVGLLPTILTPLDHRAAIEVTRIHSLAGEPGRPNGLFSRPPFRAPHHNTSTEGLLGGRSADVPGEVALAHEGTLFLDEALEFRRPVLQGLREPLEYRRVRVSRAGKNYWFPARIQLILATNRCPCGMLGRDDRSCLCSLSEVDRYWRRLGGPLLDRIDLRIQVHPRPLEDLPRTDDSAALSTRVRRAVAYRLETRRQERRNSELAADHASRACALSESARDVFAKACRSFGLSTRASLSVLRVARTIADIDRCECVGEDHLLEAISYRRYGEERPLWEPDRGW